MQAFVCAYVQFIVVLELGRDSGTAVVERGVGELRSITYELVLIVLQRHRQQSYIFCDIITVSCFLCTDNNSYHFFKSCDL